MADGTHVWSVVAGWLEPEVGGGFIWDRGGSEDNNANTHIFIHTAAHTSIPINKSPVFRHSSSLCVSRGGWGLVVVVVVEGL